MIAQHYQGNMWNIGFGLFFLFLLSQFLWGTWAKAQSWYAHRCRSRRGREPLVLTILCIGNI
jgi:hypothetical protein